ncbi:hypothetical protein [Kitasatospora sp. NPDC005856]
MPVARMPAPARDFDPEGSFYGHLRYRGDRFGFTLALGAPDAGRPQEG